MASAAEGGRVNLSPKEMWRVMRCVDLKQTGFLSLHALVKLALFERSGTHQNETIPPPPATEEVLRLSVAPPPPPEEAFS